MLTPTELAELRAAAPRARCSSDRVKWVRLIDGPLGGLRVMVSADANYVVGWCTNTRRGCICVHYTPADRPGEWRFLEWFDTNRPSSVDRAPLFQACKLDGGKPRLGGGE